LVDGALAGGDFAAVPVVVASSIVGLWYLYRCIKGWLRFNDNRAP
jgi:uncharacterized membrane protein